MRQQSHPTANRHKGRHTHKQAGVRAIVVRFCAHTVLRSYCCTHLLTTSRSPLLILVVVNSSHTNQSVQPSINPHISSLLSLGPSLAAAQPCRFTRFSATAIASGAVLSRDSAPSLPTSSARHSLRERLYAGTTKHLPACCCWPAHGRIVLLHLPSNLSHVYHQHCLSAGLKTISIPFVHDIPPPYWLSR